MSLYCFWLKSVGLMPLARRNSLYATLNAWPIDCAISCACRKGSIWGKPLSRKAIPADNSKEVTGDYCKYVKLERKLEKNDNTYILWFKDIADHSVLALPIAGRVRRFRELLWWGLRHAPPCHQNYNAADVCDVGDGPQGTVHHCFLWRTKVMTIMSENKLCLCTRGRQHTNLRGTDLCVSIQYFDSFSGDK